MRTAHSPLNLHVVSHPQNAQGKRRGYVRHAMMTMALAAMLSACSPEQANQETLAFDQAYPPQAGGTLMSAMPSDPSSMIGMVAGESASLAIGSYLFNSLLNTTRIWIWPAN